MENRRTKFGDTLYYALIPVLPIFISLAMIVFAFTFKYDTFLGFTTKDVIENTIIGIVAILILIFFSKIMKSNDLKVESCC